MAHLESGKKHRYFSSQLIESKNCSHARKTLFRHPQRRPDPPRPPCHRPNRFSERENLFSLYSHGIGVVCFRGNLCQNFLMFCCWKLPVGFLSHWESWFLLLGLSGTAKWQIRLKNLSLKNMVVSLHFLILALSTR